MLLLLVCTVNLWPMPEKTDSRARRTHAVPTGGPLLASQQQCTTPAANTNVHSSRRLAPRCPSCLVSLL